MAKKNYHKLDLITVIPSRNREKIINKYSLALFPKALVTVEESEMDTYAEFVPKAQLVAHPPLPSLAAIRNWIIDNFENEIIIMPDDDAVALHSMVSQRVTKYTDPAVIAEVCEMTATMALGVGAGYFGWNQSARPLTFNPMRPFKMKGWVGSVIGIIGKDLRYDENLSLHDDADFSLQQLMHKRIIWMDTRFHFETVARLKNPGGNSRFRSSQREQAESGYLKQKWGEYVQLGKNKSTVVTTVAVQRRGKLPT